MAKMCQFCCSFMTPKAMVAKLIEIFDARVVMWKVCYFNFAVGCVIIA